MKKFLKKSLALALILACLVTTAAGCASNEDTNGGSETSATQAENGDNSGDEVESEPLIATDIEGEIDLMMWSGDGQYHEDIGSKDWAPEDITAMNVAAVYATAKKFNETYPNVKINLYAKVGDPHGNEITWDQERENFKAEHGSYPDIYVSTDLVGDVSRGLVSDLSVYANEADYQSLNSTLMNMLNYYGVQAGIPQYLLPWGVYVNKELAEQNNIDVPDPDWNLDDYTEFVTSADNDEFFGAMDPSMLILGTATEDIMYSLNKKEFTDGVYVDFTTEAVADVLSYVPEWSTSSIWAAWDDGEISEEFMNEYGWWSYNFFAKNALLTLDNDPWMMGSAGMPSGTPNTVESADWDIYPRPSSDYTGNNVGIVIDPMAIHNYSMDDGDPAWSDAEKVELDIAYTFMMYFAADTEAMQARADQMYSAEGTLQPSLNDSFPLVTGDEFDAQMEVWYSLENHQRYQDADLMPGFQEVVRLWEEGAIYDTSDKVNVYYIEEDGQRIPCMNEWLGAVNPAISGVGKTDPAWLDTTKSKLADWTELANARFAKGEETLKQGLSDYYGVTN